MTKQPSLNDLQAAWQRQAAPSISVERLQARIDASERNRRWRIAMEIGLTGVACVVLLLPWFGDTPAPAVWLLTPFFAVFLPLVWWWSLREDRWRWAGAGQTTTDYCQMRLRQIAVARRRLRGYRLAALALLVYALGALILVYGRWLSPDLYAATTFLGAFSLIWALITEWTIRGRRRRLNREDQLLRDWQAAQT